MPDGCLNGKPFTIVLCTYRYNKIYYTVCYESGHYQTFVEETLRHHAPKSIRKFRVRDMKNTKKRN